MQTANATPALTTSRSVATGAQSPVAATPEPTFVYVAFQQGLSTADMTTFLDAYKVSVDDGPNQGGYYKLRLNDEMSADQLPQLIESMKSQTAFVTEATLD